MTSVYPGGHEAEAVPEGPAYPYLPTSAYEAVTVALSRNAAALAVIAYELVAGIANG